jgi:hypothetical protein
MISRPIELREGERRKAAAHSLLADHREAVVRRAQRALLTVLLETGSATADDVRELVELPPGIGPKCFGTVPPPLARAGIIRADGFTKTCRPVGHARPVTVWGLVNREKAESWLREHPELPIPDADQGDDRSTRETGRQGILFPIQETATPTVAAAGAAL